LDEHCIESFSADSKSLDILERYFVSDARIYITSDGRYLVQEPAISDEGAELYGIIIDKINLGVGMDAGADISSDILAKNLEDSFWDVAERIKRVDDAQRLFPHLRYYIRRDLVGYGILDVMLKDDGIEDILCSAPGRKVRVVHKKYSGLYNTLRSNVEFANRKEMERLIQRIYGRTGMEPTESRPMSVTHMPDGSRISSTFGKQISRHGPAIAIRKFPSRPLTITHMLKSGTLTVEMAAYLWTLLDARAVGLVLGVTGSGKTTLLAALLSMLHPRWRILTMEDTLELQVPHGDWVRLNTRKSYGMLGDRFDVTMRDLIDISLTQRPDCAIVGEIRLKDMDALFQSVGTGHGGLTSFHASSPDGALARMRGGGIGDGELALLWFAVHTSRIRRRGQSQRKITLISEIVQDEAGSVTPSCVYRYDIFTDRFVREMSLQDSLRYMEACRICGISDSKHDMQLRTSLLQQCADSSAYEIPAIFRILGQYHEQSSAAGL